MSGFKPPELSEFYRRIHARGLDTTSLSQRVGVSRSAVTRVLNGARRAGPLFRRVAAHLNAEELRLLNVAHSSTWNARRVAKRPQWTPEKQAALMATA